jgi:two-component sensor histidine kinase
MKYKNILLLLIYIFFPLSLNASATVDINESDSDINLLSHSFIYIDKSSEFTIDTIKEQTFQKNTQETLVFGFLPKATLWIKLELQNNSEKPLHKILQYRHPIIEKINFYDGNNITKDGTWQMSQQRDSITPTLHLSFEAHEHKTIYIQAHSDMSTLIAQVVLWNEKDFLKSSYIHQTFLFVFFGMLLVLFIYNFMLFIFTLDRAYFYYLLYLGGVIFFQGFYSGFSQFYLFNDSLNILISKASLVYIGFLLFSIVLFTREFLSTKQFPKIDAFLKYYTYTIPFAIILSYDNFIITLDVITFYIPLALIVIFTAFYSYFKGVQEAKFYMLGWAFVLFALVATNLKTTGLFDLTQYFPYINEMAFLAEALLFSIALAHRIKIITKEKIDANEKLIDLQQDEQKRLHSLVEQKTKDLQQALEHKDVLYKELNHRVKNNLQMVLSLIRLQIASTTEPLTKEQLTITQNRINSISKLYESLAHNTLTADFNTLTYFKTIANTLTQNFDKDVTIDFNIQYNLNLDILVYCGLILNELLTNSFKYAFTDAGKVKVALYKENEDIHFFIEDDGVGFDKESKNNLGLTIVKALVQKQLFGTIAIDSKNGTKIFIIWNEK